MMSISFGFPVSGSVRMRRDKPARRVRFKWGWPAMRVFPSPWIWTMTDPPTALAVCLIAPAHRPDVLPRCCFGCPRAGARRIRLRSSSRSPPFPQVRPSLSLPCRLPRGPCRRRARPGPFRLAAPSLAPRQSATGALRRSLRPPEASEPPMPISPRHRVPYLRPLGCSTVERLRNSLSFIHLV